jgi:very-short-patch-repair endonuclease
MTEKISIEEARKRGYLEQVTTKGAAERESPALRRLEAFMGLVGELLEQGYDLRLEHRFHPSRRWRFDLALMGPKVALEIDGGGWVGGRHHREQGRRSDNEKANEAQRLGWLVARVSWDHIHNGMALDLLNRLARERVVPR